VLVKALQRTAATGLGYAHGTFQRVQEDKANHYSCSFKLHARCTQSEGVKKAQGGRLTVGIIKLAEVRCPTS